MMPTVGFFGWQVNESSTGGPYPPGAANRQYQKNIPNMVLIFIFIFITLSILSG
jgi:hypothetical protein